MKKLFKSEGIKLSSRICVALVAFALVVTSFAAALQPADAAPYRHSKSKCSHKYDKRDKLTSNGSSKHTWKRTCSGCGKVWTEKENHWFQTKSYKKNNKTYHYKIQKCRCGQEKKVKEKHSFSNKRCKNCGYKK